MEKTRLTKHKNTLEAKLAQLTRPSSQLADIAIQTAPDFVDQVQFTLERELALRCLTRESRLAREVRAALARIEGGSFGICLNCEEEIKPRRLEAVPWAAYCVRCQEAAEQHEVEPGAQTIDRILALEQLAEAPDAEFSHAVEAA